MLIFLLVILIVGAILFFKREGLKKNPKQSIAIFASVILLIFITMAFTSANNFIKPDDQPLAYILNENSSISCGDNNAKLKTYDYIRNYDWIDEDSFQVYTYESATNKIFLGDSQSGVGENESLQPFIEKNPELAKYAYNSVLLQEFPFLDFMQKSYTYKFSDDLYVESILKTNLEIARNNIYPKINSVGKNYGDRKWSSRNSYGYLNNSPFDSLDGLSLKAVFLDPNNVSQNDFQNLTTCLSNAEPNTTFKNSKLPKIVVYGLPLKESNQKTINGNGDKVSTLEYVCSDPKYGISVQSSGRTQFIEFRESNNNNINIEKQADIGYVDEKGVLVRDPEPDQRFYLYTSDSFGFNHTFTYLSEDGFDPIYKNSDLMKKIFSSDQKPINDYFENCKNSTGQTISDLANTAALNINKINK